MTAKIKAVFVTIENSLKSGGGGVQLCTQDYLDLLKLSGVDLHVVTFETDRRFFTRVRRKLDNRPYAWLVPPSLETAVVAAIERLNAEAVFFNLLDFPELVSTLRRRFGCRLKLLHLSHGLESTDISVDQQVKRQANGRIGFDRRYARRLGAKIQFEADYRRSIDAVLCLSSLDAEAERRLGAKETAWFGRTIREQPLVANPMPGRVGCVSTLDHPPNSHGLVALFECLQRDAFSQFRFRLSGGPEACGKELALKFSFVDYLGPLGDSELRTEAATWSCFVHPLFHFARGCSTKVAVALGWQLPIATTVAGVRGYVWDSKILPLANSPSELSRLVMAGSDISNYSQRKEQTSLVAALQPTNAALAHQMADFLQRIIAAPA